MAVSVEYAVYYITLFIEMVLTTVLHMNAIAGDKWVEGKIAGSEINEGLWISCVKSLIRQKCIMFIDIADKASGNQLIFFLTNVLQPLCCYY